MPTDDKGKDFTDTIVQDFIEEGLFIKLDDSQRQKIWDVVYSWVEEERPAVEATIKECIKNGDLAKLFLERGEEMECRMIYGLCRQRIEMIRERMG